MALECPKCDHPRPVGPGAPAACVACGLVLAERAQRVLGSERIGRVDSDGADADERSFLQHDWENILLDLGLIEHERALALAADRLGELILPVALVRGAAVLYRQYRALQAGASR